MQLSGPTSPDVPPTMHEDAQSSSPADLLRTAAEQAVTASTPQLDQLVEGVHRLEHLVADAGSALRKAREQATGDDEAARKRRATLDDAVAALTGVHEDLYEHLAVREQARDSFVVAMFGRTGVGKSTLTEPLTAGDGRTASPGRVGWTDKRAALRPGLCFLDCPGFDPPGPDRAAHEAEARRAVLQADVVLMCFGSQNQKATEFGHVARWVAHYDKPVVVLLSVRNRAWRNPDGETHYREAVEDALEAGHLTPEDKRRLSAPPPG